MQQKLKICDCCSKPRPIWKNFIDENGERKKYCQSCWYSTGVVKQDKNKPTKQTNKDSRSLRSPILRSQKPIKRVSDRRKKQEMAYSALRRAFLAIHPFCQAGHIPECLKRAETVHHKKGRIGELLCNTQYFLAVCMPCHEHIERNPEESYELGFSEKRTT